MRKIILSMMVSLDMQIARADGNLDWFRSDAGFETEMLRLLRRVDGMMFGRVSYEMLAQYWPTAGASDATVSGGFSNTEVEKEFALLMNTVPKRVYSRTLKSAAWGPVTIIDEVDADEIDKLRRQPGRDLVLFAGASLASEFMRHDLIDEYRLMVHPVVLGNGIPLFQELTAERPLELQRSTALPCGVVLLEYERNR
ncbi:dihydrofolate reductase family protein [Povalibacter sp.]|uniref:dihydrofolate reductase family protein n=1 Tax=Povalibacter sp. TaxID=1962978 RepID=UPI002F3E4C03